MIRLPSSTYNQCKCQSANVKYRANKTRNLYKLIGEIIESVYQNNIESEVQLRDSDILERIISIEKKLDAWKSSLPPNLCVTPKEEIMRNLNSSSVFSSLSTVITLRYLIARILLHRRIIICFLNSQKEQSGELEKPEFLRLFGKPSLEMGVLAASEMIGIIFDLSEHQHHMLTTWWFSIYYSKSCCSPPPIINRD